MLRAEAELEAELGPACTAQRQRRARAGRRVSVRSEPDGTGSLWALLPAEQLRVFTLGLDELHARQRAADLAAGVQRTADQRRADLLALLPALALHALDGTAPGAGSAAGSCCAGSALVVSVHVPMATALGRSQEPGVLEGYGPVSAEHVRGLLPGAAVRQVLVDEVTGQPLSVGPLVVPLTTAAAAESRRRAAAPAGTSPEVRQRLLGLLPAGPVLLDDTPEPQHDPSRRLAELVRLRDPLCTGVGCATVSRRCDLDHEQPWPAGTTTAGNLRPRSRRCHNAKTSTWEVRRHADGSHTWTSPTDRAYGVPPAWDPSPPLGPRVGTGPDTLTDDLVDLEQPHGPDDDLSDVARPTLTPDDDPPPF